MSRTKTTLKITRHPEVVTMYRVMRGTEVLADNLQSLDDALLWQSMWAWYDEIVETIIKTPNE